MRLDARHDGSGSDSDPDQARALGKPHAQSHSPIIISSDDDDELDGSSEDAPAPAIYIADDDDELDGSSDDAPSISFTADDEDDYANVEAAPIIDQSHMPDLPRALAPVWRWAARLPWFQAGSAMLSGIAQVVDALHLHDDASTLADIVQTCQCCIAHTCRRLVKLDW